VLIALAVVVLPMLLGGRPEEGAEEAKTIELPPQPSELNFETRRFPLGETPQVPRHAPEGAVVDVADGDLPLPQSEAAARPDPAPASVDSPGDLAHVELEPRNFQDAMEQEAEPPVSEKAAPEETAGDTAPPQPPAAVAAPKPAATSGGRYVVQVASFGSVANAGRLTETLRRGGYSVLSDTVSADVGTLHRVRVGPYPTEAEAKTAVSQLTRLLPDVKPRVVDLQPDQAAQVTTPSDPLVRWVVQLGSFSSTPNADKLVERVRAEGLSAYKEAVSSAGSTIYRVRVGPFVEREEAIRVDGLIADRLSVDGVVMSAD
jgi:cell division septation protein DedD